LLAPSASERAAKAIEAKAGKSFLLGLAVGLPITVIAVIFLNLPLPVAKVLGFVVLAVFLTVSSLGLGGLAMLMGSRISQVSPETSVLAARSKGVAILSVASMAPVIGWFFIGPVILLLSIGASMFALFGSRKAEQSWASESA
jgi:hypothetical protein